MQSKEIACVQLPQEVKGLIAKQCSPSLLFTLVQVSREFQEEGERVLFADLSVDASRGGCQPLIALKAKVERAAFVQRLCVQFGDFGLFGNPSYGSLVSVLPHMPNLNDLRVRLGWRDEKELRAFETILCAQHFRLVTLFCDIRLNLEAVVIAQTNLRHLGTYSWGDTASVSNWLTSSPAIRQRSLLVFSLERASYLPYFSHLTIYQQPSPELWVEFGRVIQHSSGNQRIGLSTQDLEYITFVLDSIKDDGLLLMWRSIASLFPRTTRLEIYSPSLYHLMTTKSAVQGIQLFTRLTEIIINDLPQGTNWADRGLEYKESVIGCLEQWVSTCPCLQEVTLGQNRVRATKLGDDWQIVEEHFE
ncbi:hypothetical protein BKA70DRAFT_1423514 [Coprinopsis sp. MPI-PUGE-AT-0042]|nr:hypothetical protein BKA70DRAFT_1423514 [Coprinopsis sp. MPI-PUGE-AT-0042]